MIRTVTDQLGHAIYLTDERWEHICEEHPEMAEYETEALQTIEKGRRFQDSIRPDVFLYYHDYENLPADNTTLVCRGEIRVYYQWHREQFHHDGLSDHAAEKVKPYETNPHYL